MSVCANGSPCREAWARRGSGCVRLCVVAGQYVIVLVLRGPEMGKFGSHIMVTRLLEQCLPSIIVVQAVAKGSLAAQHGLRAGTLLRAVAGERVDG